MRDVEGTATAECPVSLISEESKRLLSFYSRCRDFHEATGGVGGFGSGDWPARMVEAFSVIHAASARADGIELSTSKKKNAD